MGCLRKMMEDCAKRNTEYRLALDYDSSFANGGNFSPRFGVAWSPKAQDPNHASWGNVLR